MVKSLSILYSLCGLSILWNPFTFLPIPTSTAISAGYSVLMCKELAPKKFLVGGCERSSTHRRRKVKSNQAQLCLASEISWDQALRLDWMGHGGTDGWCPHFSLLYFPTPESHVKVTFWLICKSHKRNSTWDFKKSGVLYFITIWMRDITQ